METKTMNSTIIIAPGVSAVIEARRVTFCGVKDNYVGRVKFYEHDNYLYSHSCGINRLTPDDALMDAALLAKDLARENGYTIAEGKRE